MGTCTDDDVPTLIVLMSSTRSPAMRCKSDPEDLWSFPALTRVSYDRMSPSFRSYLETLTACCAQPVFKSACDAGNYEVMSPRGSPLNKDYEFVSRSLEFVRPFR